MSPWVTKGKTGTLLLVSDSEKCQFLFLCDELYSGSTALLSTERFHYAWAKGIKQVTVHLVIIVGGRCGSVHTEMFYENRKLLGVIESKRDEIRRWYVSKLMEEQDLVLRSFFTQKKGGDKSGRPTGRGGEAEHLGRDVHAQNGTGYRHQNDGMVEVHKGRTGCLGCRI